MPDEPAIEITEPAAQAAEEQLEETARREYERTSQAARTQAQNPIDIYFSLMGSQLKTTGKIIKTAGKVLKTTAKVAGTAAVVGLAGGLGYLAFGLDAIITQGGLIVGDWLGKLKNKVKITYKDTIVKGIAGSALGGFLHYLFPAIHYIGDGAGNAVSTFTGSNFYIKSAEIAAKSAAFVGAAFPSFIYLEDKLYNALDSSYEPLNGEQFMKSWGRAAKFIGLPAVLNINFTPQQYQIAGAAAITAGYGFVSSKPGEKAEEAKPADNAVNMPQRGTQQQYRHAA